MDWEATQERKFELHRGFVLAFAGGTLDHDRIAFNVRMLLDPNYPEPCRTLGSEVKIRVAADSYYYADAAVTCEAVAGDASLVRAPLLVVEVLSRSTRAFDVVEKRASYRALPSLRAYLIVHTDLRRVEVDVRRSGDTGWRTETFDGETADVDGRDYRLDDVYARTRL